MTDGLRADRAPSLCDACRAPGACCTRFGLVALGVFWVDEGNAPVQAALDARRDHGTGNLFPFRPLEPESTRYKDEAGREYAYWVFTCPKLAANGRCTIYENRPETCRLYSPKSDPLCVYYVGDPPAVAPPSWWCDRCSVEVYDARCPHCGKTEEEERA